MKKKNLIVVCVLAFVILLSLFVFLNKGESDAIKFKKEYEELNGTIRKSDGAKYNSVSIDKDNPIKYIDAARAVEVIEKKSAVIYVGTPWCPWCRNAVPVLFEVAKEYDLDTIYYLDLDDEKSQYEVVDGKAVKTTDGSKGYYKLLDKLSDRLSDYTLTDNDGNKLNTGEKRIYMPYVLGVKDGKVVSEKLGTITLESGQTKYSDLTDEQYNELKSEYSELFESVFGDEDNNCGIGEVCD